MVADWRQLARNLERLAASLEPRSGDTSVSPAKKRLNARYRPFVLELARREVFCRDLAAVQPDLNLPIPKYFAEFRHLVMKFVFPTMPPYRTQAWVLLLGSARMGLDYFDPEGLFPNPPVTIELQFVFYGSAGQIITLGDQLPIARVISIPLREGLSRRQARNHLKQAYRAPLSSFLKIIRPLARKVEPPGFEVRLLQFISNSYAGEPEPDGTYKFYLPNPPHIVEMVTNFNVSLRPSARVELLSRKVVDGVLPHLEKILGFTTPQGRPSNALDGARWWAMTVFDGLSVEEIAHNMTDDDPDAPDMEEKIRQALNRLGISR